MSKQRSWILTMSISWALFAVSDIHAGNNTMFFVSMIMCCACAYIGMRGIEL